MRISDWSSDVCSSDLLEDNGVTGETADLVEIDGNEAIDALRGEEVDAAIFVGAPTSRTIGTLLAMPGVTPMSFERADAYVRRNAYLSKVVLPMGTLDLAKNLPGRDLVLLAPTATTVVTPDTPQTLISYEERRGGKEG